MRMRWCGYGHVDSRGGGEPNLMNIEDTLTTPTPLVIVGVE